MVFTRTQILGSIFVVLATVSVFSIESVRADESSDDSRDVLAAVNKFYDAFEAKSLDQLSHTVDTDLIVLEDTEKNMGWPDYRDNHIGKEMKEWKFFRAMNRKPVKIETHGTMAYAIMELTLEIGLLKKTIKLAAAETLILVKVASGPWRVKHVHSSARKL